MPNLRSIFQTEVRFSEPLFSWVEVRHYWNRPRCAGLGRDVSDVIVSSKFLARKKWQLFTWKKGEIIIIFFFCLAVQTSVRARCLLAVALYRTVTTSRIHKLEFLCISRRPARKPQRGKPSWEPTAKTSIPKGLLKSARFISWPVASRGKSTLKEHQDGQFPELFPLPGESP